MPKNYYFILGVGANASNEEIKSAFRRRAFELHPDRSGLSSEPFQEVQEAYSVLTDPSRRSRFDQEFGGVALRWARAESASRAEPLVPPRSRERGEPLRAVEPAGGFWEASLADSFEMYRPSFEELFDRFWSNFEPFSRPKAERLENLTLEVVISAEEACSGGQVRVWIPMRAICSACGGHGAIGAYECWRCQGHGALTANQPLDLEYPPGVLDGYALRVPLSAFGIDNFYLTVLMRVSSARD